ncbi:MAG: PSD1 domain-containing protein [Planctomycetales bacterium]|nr:PSD1 domain-containing protein [Planctomycetales bacterium]
MRRFTIALCCLLAFCGVPRADELGTADSSATDSLGWSDQWTMSRAGGASQWFEIRGTGNRNNPLRRKLEKTFDGDQIFVRFQLRYDAASIDTPDDGNGEFFVLWLDENDGGDSAGHNGGVPNVGIHVNGKTNAFMARFSSSSESFGDVPLQGDRVYNVLACLSRSNPGSGHAFDQLSVWIDPKITDAAKPAIRCTSKDAIRTVNWIGFSSGQKTEPSDRISVSELSLAATWLESFGLKPDVKLVRDPAPPPPPAVVSTTPTVDFANDVYPILSQHCFGCHSGDDPESGLRLDHYDELLNHVSPREAGSSPLVLLVESKDPDKQMPPPDGTAKPLSPDQIAVLRRWIDEGVTWDHQQLPTPILKSDHWAFQPITLPEITLPEPPSSNRHDQARTPVDSFIFRKQESLGVMPADSADWPTLQRRIALDLTGLPPSAFPGLDQATSHEQLDQWIDQLLSSQAYAERWGRFWLDLARWAESNGHQHNRPRPHAWRYRDYIIDSFRTDKPYDLFILEQIAGDELPGSSQSLAATGFLAAARYSGNELDKEIQRNDILVDVVNTTAQTFLGMTMECAQCHTHKFDPITIRDYYRFQAFFTRGQPGNLLLTKDAPDAKLWIDARQQLFDSVHTRLVDNKRRSGVPDPVLVIPKSVVSGMNSKERQAFQDLEDAIATAPQVWGWSGADSETTVAPHEMRWPLPHDRAALGKQKTYLRIRGDVKAVGPEVRPGWPAAFGPTPGSVSSRTDLAEWLVSRDNPLTARVWVNRIWQWHFGRGIVETSGDFGTQGTPPTHPELLDWLAGELIESGWSTRHIHRLILRSSTYRQSATFSQSNFDVDPECKTIWRWVPRRLESEAIRDSILAVAGQLDRTAGGPSVADDNDISSFRRSVYLQQQRERIPESLTLFDSPPALSTCSRRRTSTVSLQPLYLLNSDFMQSAGIAFADRLRQSTDKDQSAAVAVRLALGRDATDDEIARLNEFLDQNSIESMCLALLNLSEFLYMN